MARVYRGTRSTLFVIVGVLVMGTLLYIGSQTYVTKSTWHSQQKVVPFSVYQDSDGQYSELHKDVNKALGVVESKPGFISRLANSVRRYIPIYRSPPGRIGPPELSLTLLWQNVTKGVLECRTGKVKRPIDRPHGQQSFVANPLQASWKSENNKTRKISFTNIFKKKLWGGQQMPVNGSDAVVGSGPGSTLKNSIQVRKTLDVVIGQVKAMYGKSKIRMLDIPCGDLTWMSEFMKDRNDVEYYGMDIVPDIIEHHKRVYTPKYPHMTFINQDIVAEPLKTEFDLIHTRQMTQHLTSADTMRVFKHFKDSGSHFLMATTIFNYKNVDLKSLDNWRYRAQDLSAPPFSLPAPICQSADVAQELNAVWIMN